MTSFADSAREAFCQILCGFAEEPCPDIDKRKDSGLRELNDMAVDFTLAAMVVQATMEYWREELNIKSGSLREFMASDREALSSDTSPGWAYEKIMELFRLLYYGKKQKHTGLSGLDLLDITEKENFRRAFIEAERLIKALEHIEEADRKVRDSNSKGALISRVPGETYEAIKSLRLIRTGKSGVDEYAKSRIISEPHFKIASDKVGNREAGSFYTPEWIVRHILSKTLKRKMRESRNESCKAELSFKEIVASGATVLDPSMGVGFFLLEALDQTANSCMEMMAVEDGNRLETLLSSGKEAVCSEALMESLTGNKTKLLKRYLLKNCIYGVELDETAVRVARASFSIEVYIKGCPSPFLGWNIKCGDSLCGIPPGSLEGIVEKEIEEESKKRIKDNCLFMNRETRRMQNEPDMTWKQRKASMEKYRNITEGPVRYVRKILLDADSQKRGASKEVDSIEEFHWDIEFPFIFKPFSKKGDEGFDIVVGNPPYIKSMAMKRNSPAVRKRVRHYYESARGNWDIYIPFIELSSKTVKCDGFAGLITPIKWLSADYGRALRELLKERLLGIDDFSAADVFKGVKVFPAVCFVSGDEVRETVMEAYAKKVDTSFPKPKYTSSVSRAYMKKSLDNWGIHLSPEKYLLETIENNGIEFASICQINESLTADEAYRVNAIIRNSDYGIRVVNTGTIDRYRSLWGLRQAKIGGRKYQKPCVLKEQALKCLSDRRLDRTAREKIVITGITVFEAFYDERGEYMPYVSTITVADIVEMADRWSLLAVLNSKLMTFYLRECFHPLAMGGGSGLNFTAPLIRRIPVPEAVMRNGSGGRMERIIRLAETGDEEKLIEEIFDRGGDKNDLSKVLSQYSKSRAYSCSTCLQEKTHNKNYKCGLTEEEECKFTETDSFSSSVKYTERIIEMIVCSLYGLDFGQYLRIDSYSK